MLDLLELVEPFKKLLRLAFGEFVGRCSSTMAYHDMLVQTHHYVQETVPTIEAVLRAEPSHPLVSYLSNLAREELGHDKMLLRDLKKLPSFPAREISPYILEFVALERSLPLTADPVSELCGDIAILDCSPPSKQSVLDLVRSCGVPIQAATMFLYHADADIIHREWARSHLLHPSVNKTVMLNRAITVCRLFRKHWEWMTAKHNSPYS